MARHGHEWLRYRYAMEPIFRGYKKDPVRQPFVFFRVHSWLKKHQADRGILLSIELRGSSVEKENDKDEGAFPPPRLLYQSTTEPSDSL